MLYVHAMSLQVNTKDKEINKDNDHQLRCPHDFQFLCMYMDGVFKCVEKQRHLKSFYKEGT